MYSKNDFKRDLKKLFLNGEGNTVEIPSEGAVSLYEMPVCGFASASDELFLRFREETVIGRLFLTPEEWLPEAKTVVSLFFPFSDIVRSTNAEDRMRPSVPWVYARFEGQEYINGFMRRLQETLFEAGIRTCVPSLDPRFEINPVTLEGEEEDLHVDSRWSERHSAYVCGLGTFGMSRGLITDKGMAGRFASILTDAEFEPDSRDYSGVYDYCIRCGACAVNCPASAITMERGKNNLKCRRYVEAMKKLYAPRYGCGKCQVGVPCECGIPGTAKSL